MKVFSIISYFSLLTIVMTLQVYAQSAKSIDQNKSKISMGQCLPKYYQYLSSKVMWPLRRFHPYNKMKKALKYASIFIQDDKTFKGKEGEKRKSELKYLKEIYDQFIKIMKKGGRIPTFDEFVKNINLMDQLGTLCPENQKLLTFEEVVKKYSQLQEEVLHQLDHEQNDIEETFKKHEILFEGIIELNGKKNVLIEEVRKISFDDFVELEKAVEEMDRSLDQHLQDGENELQLIRAELSNDLENAKQTSSFAWDQKDREKESLQKALIRLKKMEKGVDANTDTDAGNDGSLVKLKHLKQERENFQLRKEAINFEKIKRISDNLNDLYSQYLSTQEKLGYKRNQWVRNEKNIHSQLLNLHTKREYLPQTFIKGSDASGMLINLEKRIQGLKDNFQLLREKLKKKNDVKFEKDEKIFIKKWSSFSAEWEDNYDKIDNFLNNFHEISESFQQRLNESTQNSDQEKFKARELQKKQQPLVQHLKWLLKSQRGVELYGPCLGDGDENEHEIINEQNVNKNTKGVCPLCCEDYQDGNRHLVKTSCDHEFCSQCLQKQVHAGLQTKKLPPQCPACPQRLFFNSSLLAQVPPFNEREQHLHYLAERETILNHLRLDKDAVRCSGGGECFNYQFKTFDQVNNRFDCSFCKTSTCTKCNDKFHDDDCKQRMIEKQKKADALMRKAGFMDCPYCQVWNEREEGCNYVVCKNCENPFDFTTGGPWTKKAARKLGYHEDDVTSKKVVRKMKKDQALVKDWGISTWKNEDEESDDDRDEESEKDKHNEESDGDSENSKSESEKPSEKEGQSDKEDEMSEDDENIESENEKQNDKVNQSDDEDEANDNEDWEHDWTSDEDH